MASPTPSSSCSSSSASSHSSPSSFNIVSTPIATNDQHVCFICLQNETDTPNARWVNACPCTLEAHEECMLRWIAEMEGSSDQQKTGHKCPACKAPIIIEEPYDPIVAFRDKLYRKYSRISPYILLVIVSGGTMAGAAAYGWSAACIFAGHDAVSRWFGTFSRRRIPSTTLKVVFLSALGPGLVITRWLSSLGTVVLLPFSVLYSASLVARDDLPTWPPSPQWAIAMMPYVQLSYNFLYYDLFGSLERRLNNALRGRPPTEEAAPRQEQAPAAPAAQQNNVQPPDGVWGAVANVGRAFLNVFMDLPAAGPLDAIDVEAEIELRIGGGDDINDQEGQGRNRAGEAAGQGNGGNGGRPAQQQQPAQAQPVQQNQQPQQNQNNQNQQRNNNNNDGEPSLLTTVINGIVTSLLFPAISYGMGELIRAVVPKAWVTPPRFRRPATGILQEQWGRSLVGGCLFVVLKDAFALYTKYRRVQVKAHRRVKNVKKPGGEGLRDR